MAPDRSPEVCAADCTGHAPRAPPAPVEVSATDVALRHPHPVPSGTHIRPACERRTLAGATEEDGVRRLVVGMALLVGLVAGSARAQGWSAMSGQTLGTGAGMIWGQ